MENNFYIHEYQALRDEMVEKMRQINEADRFMLLGLAASIAWLISESGNLDPVTSFIGAWIPFVVILWFNAIRKDQSEAIDRLAR